MHIDCKISLVSCSICSFLLICTPQAGASFPASQRCIGGGADAQVSRRTTIQEQAESTHGPIVGKASCARTCCHLVRLVVCMGPGASTSLAIALSPQLWPLHTISTYTQPSISSLPTYRLLSGLCNVLVRFEEGSDVHGLTAPDVTVNSPVEGELQGAAVEVAVGWFGQSIPSMRHIMSGIGRRDRYVEVAYRTWVRAADMAAVVVCLKGCAVSGRQRGHCNPKCLS